MDYLTHNEIKYVQQHLEENIQLLKTLTEIPSPTFHEKTCYFLLELAAINRCECLYG